jgi:hypothetical protein
VDNGETGLQEPLGVEFRGAEIIVDDKSPLHQLRLDRTVRPGSGAP